MPNNEQLGTPGSLVPVQEAATPGPGVDIVWVVSSVTQSIGRVTTLEMMFPPVKNTQSSYVLYPVKHLTLEKNEN